MECLPGKFRDVSLICTDCSSGKYRTTNDDSTFCQKCELGRYQTELGRSFCLDCSPGKFSNTIGRHRVCSSCPNGWYQSEPNATLCIQSQENSLVLPGGIVAVVVPLGSFKHCTFNQVCSSFEACPSGWIGNTPPSNKCDACEKGTTSFSGSLTCISCAKGKYSENEATTECKNCALDTYQDQELVPSLDCKACPDGYDQPSKGEPSCVSLGWVNSKECTGEEYLNTTDKDPIKHKCVTCPIGASCVGSINISNIMPKQGWFRCSNNISQYEECRGTGEIEACPGWPTWKNLSSMLNMSTSRRQCSEQYASPQVDNPLCGA